MEGEEEAGDGAKEAGDGKWRRKKKVWFDWFSYGVVQ